MTDPDDADRLRAEVRGLRRSITLLIALSCLAVAASTVAIILALRTRRASEALYGPQALYGPRTLVTDRIVTTELHFAFDADSAAARLFGSPLYGPARGSPGRDRIPLSLRPGRIDMDGMLIHPGAIALFGRDGRNMTISVDSLNMGLQLFARDDMHSWPVDTLRLRHWSTSRRR